MAWGHFWTLVAQIIVVILLLFVTAAIFTVVFDEIRKLFK